jgi:capsular polysaccharide transport system permease protein
MAFPEIKILDILFASALLEIISACSVVIVFFIFAWGVGIDAIPKDIVQASYALGACILLGIGFGLLNGVIVLAYPPWITGYVIVHITLWVSAGILFVPDALPPPVRDIAAYQPVLQIIEWVRSAYYEGYGNIVLDRSYPIIFGVVCVFLGLILERAIRGRLLSAR